VRDADLWIAGLVGLPVAAVFCAGPILGLTPRTLLPSFRVVGIVLSLRRSLQRPSSPSSPARPIHRPRSERGQIGQAPLMRFRLFPSAFTGRAVPSELTMLRTIPLRRSSNPGTHAKGSARPCGFFAPRVSGAFSFALWRRRPRGSFVAGSLLGTRTGLADRAVITT